MYRVCGCRNSRHERIFVMSLRMSALEAIFNIAYCCTMKLDYSSDKGWYIYICCSHSILLFTIECTCCFSFFPFTSNFGLVIKINQFQLSFTNWSNNLCNKDKVSLFAQKIGIRFSLYKYFISYIKYLSALQLAI